MILSGAMVVAIAASCRSAEPDQPVSDPRLDGGPVWEKDFWEACNSTFAALAEAGFVGDGEIEQQDGSSHHHYCRNTIESDDGAKGSDLYGLLTLSVDNEKKDAIARALADHELDAGSSPQNDCGWGSVGNTGLRLIGDRSYCVQAQPFGDSGEISVESWFLWRGSVIRVEFEEDMRLHSPDGEWHYYLPSEVSVVMDNAMKALWDSIEESS